MGCEQQGCGILGRGRGMFLPLGGGGGVWVLGGGEAGIWVIGRGRGVSAGVLGYQIHSTGQLQL